MTDRPRNVHDLKIRPQYFEAVARGAKGFEVRVNDRDFKVGDHLLLREWEDSPRGGGKEGWVDLAIKPHYTGRYCIASVGYLCKIPQAENLVGMDIMVVFTSLSEAE